MSDGSRQKLGHRPTWGLDDSPGGTFVEARALDSRDRFSLPSPVRQGLSWLAPNGPALGFLDATRLVRLHPWDSRGPVESLAEQHKDSASHGDRASIDELIQLQAAYQRLYIDPEGRVELPLAFVVHLELRSSVPPAVYVVRFAEQVELWGPAQFATALQRAPRLT